MSEGSYDRRARLNKLVVPADEMNHKIANQENLSGWLSPDGTFYETDPLMDVLHEELAQDLAQRFYLDEWVQTPDDFCASILFLWSKGWIKVDTIEVSTGGNEPSQAQIMFLAQAPYLPPVDEKYGLARIRRVRMLMGLDD